MKRARMLVSGFALSGIKSHIINTAYLYGLSIKFNHITGWINKNYYFEVAGEEKYIEKYI